MHNDDTGKNEAGDGIIAEEKNSGDLGDIIGTVYCYSEEECWDTEAKWESLTYNFPILQDAEPSSFGPITFLISIDHTHTDAESH